MLTIGTVHVNFNGFLGHIIPLLSFFFEKNRKGLSPTGHILIK
jgi:hypothetical protein